LAPRANKNKILDPLKKNFRLVAKKSQNFPTLFRQNFGAVALACHLTKFSSFLSLSDVSLRLKSGLKRNFERQNSPFLSHFSIKPQNQKKQHFCLTATTQQQKQTKTRLPINKNNFDNKTNDQQQKTA